MALTWHSFTFVGLLMYSVYGYRRAKQQGQRGHYVAAHNPAVYHPAVPTEYAPPYQNAPPYQQNTAYYPQTATLLGGQHDQQLPPYQADGVNVFSCEKEDTCVSAGKDPVHNFMSYGDDKCLDRFTKGRVARMSTAWQLFRAPGAAS